MPAQAAASPHSSDDARSAIRALTYADEAALVRALMAGTRLDGPGRAAIVAEAAALVEKVRERSSPSVMEAFLAEYGLSTDEGVGLMCLAEALLRVPDAQTIDELIADKIEPSNWGAHLGKSSSSLVNAATWGLMLTGRVLDDDPSRPAAGAARPRAPDGRAGGAPRGRPGDEADGPQLRARRDHPVSDGPRPHARGEGLHLFLRHARRGRAHSRRRGALRPRLRRRHQGDRRARHRRRAHEPRHFGQALGAASALRMGAPRRGDARTGPARAGARPRRRPRQDRVQHRRGGGRAARPVARRRRRHAPGARPRRLGRLRRRGAGLRPPRRRA